MVLRADVNRGEHFDRNHLKSRRRSGRVRRSNATTIEAQETKADPSQRVTQADESLLTGAALLESDNGNGRIGRTSRCQRGRTGPPLSPSSMPLQRSVPHSGNQLAAALLDDLPAGPSHTRQASPTNEATRHVDSTLPCRARIVGRIARDRGSARVRCSGREMLKAKADNLI